MSKNPLSYILFFVASFLAILAVVMQNETLLLIAKPIVLPAISFYYFQMIKDKINWLFVLVLSFNFLSDIIVSFNLHYEGIPTAILNMISYMIFIYFSVKDMSLKKISISSFLYFLLIFLSCFILMRTVLSLLITVDSMVFYVYIVYGVILSLLTTVIVSNYINNQNIRFYYALVMCICFLVVDVFYAIYTFYVDLEIFMIFNQMALYGSLYYMTMYMISKSISEEKILEE